MHKSGTPWSDEDEVYIKANYQNMSDEEMAVALGRSKFGVRERRYQLGCKLSYRQKEKIEPGKSWERVTKWLVEEEALEMLDMMKKQGLVVELITQTGNKQDKNFAVSRLMVIKSRKQQWQTKDKIYPIPKLDHSFNMDEKNPWDVQSAPIHATIGGS